MDLPDCDAQKLENTYRQFGLVNRIVSGWRRLYVKELRPVLSAGPASILDIGSGGGDLAVMLARWAARDGLAVRVTGVDPDPRAAAFARTRTPIPGVDFRQAHTAELVSEGAAFDVVISNHVLHHLGTEEFNELLVHSDVLARKKALHNDLRRSAVAFALFGVATLPLRNSFIREDGLTSIRRSYTGAELSALAPPGWTVEPGAAFHQVLALHRRGHER
ncbi:class I SAM-dependent methyltransferase [Pseudarthrobacter chlorophenolicus]